MFTNVMLLKKTITAVGITFLFGITIILFVPSINKVFYHILVDSILKESIPYIYGTQVDINNNVILDVRTLEEYEVSHLPKATWAGKENAKILEIGKDTKIIVYCSLGRRSELKCKQLIENGYTNVYNLYGGIIKWHNDGRTTIDSSGNLTETIHPYSWFWVLWFH